MDGPTARYLHPIAGIDAGTTPGFAAARAMYVGRGFEPVEPFGGYVRTEDSTFYTLTLV